MNNGILTQLPQPPAMPYELLGRPTPAPMPAVDYALDVDAADYIRRVQAADGQQLELPVRLAFDAFVRGCKSDGILAAIKASCILAGARTLSGALVPLVGAAPTNFSFVSGDYNRKTGLIGNGATKYLATNRLNNSDPTDDAHISTYVTTAATGTTTDWYMGTGNLVASYLGILSFKTNRFISGYNRSGSAQNIDANATRTGFMGTSRNAGINFTGRSGGAYAIVNLSSSAPGANAIITHGISDGGNLSLSNVRLSFYSVGTSLDLALLDARVTTLMNTLAAVL